MKILTFLALLIVVLPSASAATCQDVANTSPPQIVCMEISPLVQSGAGSQWSKWYALKTTGPKGYKLMSLTFRLEGPHPCAADYYYSSGVGSKKDDSSSASDDILGSLGDIQKLNYALIHFDTPTGMGSWAQCREKHFARLLGASSTSSIEWEFCFQGWTQAHFDWNGSAGGPSDVPKMIQQSAKMATRWVKEK